MKEPSLCCVWPRGWSGFKRFLQQGQIQLLPNEQAVLQLEIMANIWCKVSWKILASGQSVSLKVKQLSFHFWPRDWSNFLRFLLEFYLCPNCLYPLSIKWNWRSVCLTENILRSNSSIIHILLRSHHHWSFLEKSFCFSTKFLIFTMFSWSGNCGIFESLLDREHSWPLENVHWIDIWNLEHRTHFIELPNFQKMP